MEDPNVDRTFREYATAHGLAAALRVDDAKSSISFLRPKTISSYASCQYLLSATGELTP